MVENMDVKVSGKKDTCSLKGVPVVKSTYSIISKKVADQIGPFEVGTITDTRWTTIKVDVAAVDIEVQKKKKRFWVIVLDQPYTFVGTGTFAELKQT